MDKSVVLGNGEEHTLARPIKRLGARSLDSVLALILLYVFRLPPLFALVVLIAYELWLLQAYGQTLGKRIVGLKVIRLDNGGLLSWNQSIQRFLVPNAPSLAGLGLQLLLLGVGALDLSIVVGVLVILYAPVLAIFVYATVLGDERQQGWHDKRASSVVVTV